MTYTKGSVNQIIVKLFHFFYLPTYSYVLCCEGALTISYRSVWPFLLLPSQSLLSRQAEWCLGHVMWSCGHVIMSLVVVELPDVNKLSFWCSGDANNKGSNMISNRIQYVIFDSMLLPLVWYLKQGSQRGGDEIRF